MKFTKGIGTITFLSLLCGTVEAEETQPNIILFLVDDMGWQDTSLPFYTHTTPLNERYHTPNMERLAEMGTKFTQAYASSVSSPSRCSLLTGVNASRHRVTNWTHKIDTPTDEEHSQLSMPLWNVNGIQPEEGIANSFAATSFVQILSQNGSSTIHCGKAHFGATDTPSANPLNYGFDINIAGHAAGGLASYLGVERFGHNSEGSPISGFAIPGMEEYWDKDIFITEALTQEALKALDKVIEKENPFFLYMSHYAVHIPLQADNRFLEKYLQQGLSYPEAAYATMVEGVDKSLGDIMNYLTEKGEIENTIILFMSDNGGYSLQGRTPPLHTHNQPLRSGKGSAYEGGIREPMILYWKGVTKPNTTIEESIIIEDFFPSILEMANIEDYNTIQNIDGISFIPLLKDKRIKSKKRSLIWNMPNNWISGNNKEAGIGPTCTIRRGDYKLIYWYEDGTKELYNIRTDIGETKNLVKKYPLRTKRLSKYLSNELRKYNAQRPSFRSTGELCPWPDGK
ncbi:MAG: sulfatase [Bacteroidaceae bacterium]|nr:sulfatase [Bacteroidaceae bacterium]